MKILVTGGGFIGSHVTDALLNLGHEVIIFDRKFKEQAVYHDERVTFFMGDVTNRDALSEAIYLCDGAINLAGILGTAETVDNPYPSVDTNIVGGLNFLESLRRHKKRGVQITVGNHFMNNSYAITKTTIERFALMYNTEHKTECAIVRGLNAYGTRQKVKPVRKIIPNFVIRALRGEPIPVYGDGTQQMDMIYVTDLADILVSALLSDHGCYDQVIDAGSGVGYTVNEIAEEVVKATGSTAGINHLPMRAGEPPQSRVVADTTLLNKLFPEHFANLISLADGVKTTVEWYRNNWNLDEI